HICAEARLRRQAEAGCIKITAEKTTNHNSDKNTSHTNTQVQTNSQNSTISQTNNLHLNNPYEALNAAQGPSNETMQLS
ncbi:hypothetical protein GcM3_003030, partial [Golovinomyces cichoracearum]